MTASTGDWSGNGVTYTLQWQRCSTDGSGCGPIPGAGGSTYTVDSADIGHVLRIAVTATNHNGSATATSTATDVVAPPPAPAPSTTTPTTTTTPSTPTTTTTTTTTKTTTTTATTTTAATTTAAPPPSGTVYFDGRAKNMTALSSTSTTSQTQSPTLWDCLCFNNNSITLASDGTFGKAYHAVIGPGDRSPWNAAMPSYDADGRVTKGRSNDIGKWDWFAFALRVPSGWSNPDWATVLSLEYETLSADQIGVHIDPSSTGPLLHLYMNTGQLSKNSSGFYAGTVSGNQGQIAKVTYGQWLEIVIGVKVASDSTGAVEVYTRTPGGTWTHPIEKLNVPTWAYGCTSYGCVNANGTNSDGSQHNVLDKTGLYYGYWNTATTSFPEETVDISGLSRASSLATAQSLLP